MKKTTQTIAIALGLSALSATSAQAVTLAAYNFDSTNGTVTVSSANLATSALFAVTSVETGVTASNIALGSGLNSATFINDGTFQVAESNGLANGAQDNITGAHDDGEYIEFTLTADAGHQLDLETLTFDYARGTNGPNDFSVRTSVDGFASDVFFRNQAAAVGTDAIFTTAAGQTVDLSAAQFQGLDSITLRIVVDDRQSNTDGGSGAVFDNLLVEGEVVPEPSSTALLGLGGLALILRRRR